MLAVETDQLSRYYRTKKGGILALDHVSLTVPAGVVFGLLGPNGAGKTTLVKILTTLLLPTGGSARVCGMDVEARAREVRRITGFSLGGERGLYGRLSAKDNLRYFGALWGLSGRNLERRVAAVIETVQLADRQDSRVEEFSRGMKQRLHIARALISDPAVLFLDEPTSGLDPLAARSIRRLITDLARVGGKTVVMATHDMAEVDRICDKIAVLARGKVLYEGTPEGLKASAGLHGSVLVELEGATEQAIDALRRLSPLVQTSTSSKGYVTATIPSDGLADNLSRIMAVLADVPGCIVHSVRFVGASLEDAYLVTVADDARTEPATSG